MDIQIPPAESRANHALLRRLLAERNREPERAESIDGQIREAFERTAAVLVMDMVGFSRISLRSGIIHYLAMIAEMDQLARPPIAAHGGIVLKQEADNLFALFDTPTQAYRAALAIFDAFDQANVRASDDRHIRGCIGIGFGPLLVIDDADVFGCEMNLACKLGEDHAAASEILLTADAFAALEPGLPPTEPASYHVAGVPIHCHRHRHGAAEG
ncbi:adenylate/guanylate cyclase domain-containing protein [Tundrisphaera sp. TA3]|uniref:adenylate/guanylate cyclase domain-containing protein n=1 Tax=Tundrisphaera sp. TA3 TaxID=3435775 RepID=UPI003EBA28D0